MWALRNETGFPIAMSPQVEVNPDSGTESRLPLSVFTITLNEEANIGRLLSSVKDFADELLIVDSGSSDNTLKIAESFGARIISNAWPGYSQQKQFALEHCVHDWCLCLDADEEVTPELAARLPELLQDTEIAAYRFGRKDCFVGSAPPDGVHLRGHTRLLRKSRCRFDLTRTVHEGVIVDGRISRIDVAFLHYGYDDFAGHNDKNNKYSGLKAAEKAHEQPTPSYLRLIFAGPVKFLQSYVVHRNFLWGWRGFVQSMAIGYYGFSIEARRFEIAARLKTQNDSRTTAQKQ